ncbi:MAG: alpha/beta hydrolase fold domain-containing protein [Planctomycetota bacterium]
MKGSRVWLWLVGFAVLVAGDRPAATQESSTMNLPESAVYASTPQGELSVYFYYPEGHTPDAQAPAVLFFFGGGWVGGGHDHLKRQAQHLADRGIVGITCDYRTKNAHGTTPFECVADAINAMRFVVAHAQDLGLDPKRLGAGGGSAGGHLAMSLSTVKAGELIPPAADATLDVEFRPAALVLFNPVYDNGPEGYGHERVGERYVDFSPAHNLHADMPPTLVMLGDQDNLIPVSTAEKVRDDMTALGVRSDLIVYPDQRHGFFNQEETGMYQATEQAMDDFLVSLDWLEPLP